MITFLPIPIFFAFLSMLSFGFTDFIAAVYARKTNDYAAIILNNFIGLLFSLGILLLRPDFLQYLTELSLHDTLVLVVMGLANALAILFLIKGLYVGNVGIVSGVGSNFGIFVALLAAFALGETLSLPGWIAVIMASLGVVLASYDANERKKVGKGINYALMSMILWGLAIFLIILLSRSVHWFLIEFFTFAVGTVISFFLLAKKRPKIQIDLSIGILAISVLFEISAYYALNQASNHPNSGLIGAITGSYAVVTTLLTVLILKEKFAVGQKVGLLLIVLGLVGVNIYG